MLRWQVWTGVTLFALAISMVPVAEGDLQITCETGEVMDVIENTNSGLVDFTISASDNDGPVTNIDCRMTASPFSPVTDTDSFLAGVTSLTCQASNDTATVECVFIVTVNDDEPPSITCPTLGTMYIPPGVSQGIVLWDPVFANDVVDGLISPTCVRELDDTPAGPGDLFSLGETSLNCTATDDNGNSISCLLIILCVVNNPPVVTCPTVTPVNVIPGTNQASVTWADVTANDDVDGVLQVTCTPSLISGDSFLAAVTTAICSATDQFGLTGSCDLVITVLDNEPAVMTCPDNASAFRVGTTGAPVTWIPATAQAADVVNSNIQTACTAGNPAVTVVSGDVFELGSTVVTCTSTDGSGNVGSCSFTIIVYELPSLVCPGPVFVNVIPDLDYATPPFNDPTPSDFLSEVTIFCWTFDFAGMINPVVSEVSFLAVGVTIVWCEGTDLSGATASCNFVIIVTDNQAPDVTCPVSNTPDAEPGTTSGIVTWVPTMPTAIDVVDGLLPVTCRRMSDSVVVSSGDLFVVGFTVVVCSAEDLSNNVGDCTFTVEVLDSTFVPFGDSQGDTRLPQTATRMSLSADDLISPIFRPRSRFPYCDRLYEEIYFTDNGVVILQDAGVPRSPYSNAQSNLFDDFNSAAIVSPFWTNIKASFLSGTNTIYYGEYDSSTPGMLGVVNGRIASHPTLGSQHSGFSASWVLVITWNSVQGFTSTSATVTFQVVLVTDYINSFALFSYANMNWEADLVGNPNVRSGFTCGGFGGAATPLFAQPERRFQPDLIVGNTQRLGYWIQRLETNNPLSYINPYQYCYAWEVRQFGYTPLPAFFFPPCPCSLFFVTFRLSFRSIVGVFPSVTSPFFDIAICYVFRFRSPAFPGPRCCYSLRTFQLYRSVTTSLVASVIERYPEPSSIFFNGFLYQRWFEEEVMARRTCCELTNLCFIYRSYRRPVGCFFISFFRFGWGWGDPHISTLDNVEYTFNGLGEYTLVLVDDPSIPLQFEVQARTARAIDADTNQPTDSTLFVAFAARHSDANQIEVKMNDEGNALVTTVAGNVVVTTVEGTDYNNLTVLRTEDEPFKVQAVWSSGIQITVSQAVGAADIEILLDNEYRGNTSGLYGYWDGDPSNDARRRDGLLQEATGPGGTMLDRDYFEFGNTWRNTPETSIFTYVTGTSWTMFNILDFAPRFLEDLINSVTPEVYQAAMMECQNRTTCVYDRLATNDPSVAAQTLKLTVSNENMVIMNANAAPNITDVGILRVTVGASFSMQVSAIDSDGDDVTFQLAEAIPGAEITAEGLFTWTPADTSIVSLGFVASDGIANTSLEAVVTLCNCMNEGVCLFDQYTETSNIAVDNFATVLCDCTAGWTGDFCDVDFDACADNPCFVGVTCIDNSPPSINGSCGSCPEGLQGDGSACEDVNECDVYTPTSQGGMGCDQTCVNVLRSFNCSCLSGYLPFLDGRVCNDINECIVGTDDCSGNATCANTDGSFNCTCLPGFMGTGQTCTEINECNLSNDCSPIATCRNTVGSYTCTCPSGYEGDGRTCSDINECARFLDDCHALATCTNLNGTFDCSCDDGWVGTGTFCDNENECIRIPFECDVNAACSDTVGSFFCTCKAGFVGNGSTCDDVDECALRLDDCQQVCNNYVGTHNCSCLSGFTLSNLTMTTCTADNPCDSTSCIGGTCFNDNGGQSCSCPRGSMFNISGSSSCEDVDECAANIDDCEVDCNNTMGGYTCGCPPGSELAGNQRGCTDIDECILQIDNCNVNAACNNALGSFFCACNLGYTGNGIICTEMNECQAAPPPCIQNCTNIEGSFSCTCQEGYFGDPYVDCMDIDECTTTPDLCDPKATCENIPGSVQCTCITGYTGDGFDCTDRNECGLGACDTNAQCNNTIGSFFCTCLDGYMTMLAGLPGECEDVNECEFNLHDCDLDKSTCENNNGSFSCLCNDGYMPGPGGCVDIDECSSSGTCSGSTSSCRNLPGSYECNCPIGFYLNMPTSTCPAGEVYNGTVSFTDIGGVVVGSSLFDLTVDSLYVGYLRQLKADISEAFLASAVAGTFGEIVILDIEQLVMGEALVSFRLTFTQAVPTISIISAFTSQLTGTAGTQLASVHHLLPDTFILGSPRCPALPCMNGGMCSEDNQAAIGYACACINGYTGTDCDIAPCMSSMSSPCLNNGICTDNTTASTGYVCTCLNGYTGAMCETALPCELISPCRNGGTCTNDVMAAGGYTCNCAIGFEGLTCETGQCLLTCQNSGTLVEETCECTCPPTRSGTDCSVCQLSCENGGTMNPTSCLCTCSTPWFGTNCIECGLSCQNGGTLDLTTCQCTCPNLWFGAECNDCTGLTCANEGTLDSSTCSCSCIQNWAGSNCMDCPLLTTGCVTGSLDEQNCECICQMETSGLRCGETNPCLTANRCPAVGETCVADVFSNLGYECLCNPLAGYFTQADGSCTLGNILLVELRVLAVNGLSIGFISPHDNRATLASREFHEDVRVVISFVLRNDPRTSNVVEVRGLVLRSGSIIVTMSLATSLTSTPQLTADTVMNVLAETALVETVTGNNLTLDTSFPAEPQSNLTCPTDLCQNGGTCVVSGLFPSFIFTCSCAESFSGDVCDISAPTPASLASGSIALIVVGVVLLLLAIVCIFLCMCIVMRRRLAAGYYGNGPYRQDNHGFDEDYYPRSSPERRPQRDVYFNERFNAPSQRPGDGWEEENRMRRLQQIMNHSTYLRRDQQSRHDDFVRPYIATGEEELHIDRAVRERDFRRGDLHSRRY